MITPVYGQCMCARTHACAQSAGRMKGRGGFSRGRGENITGPKCSRPDPIPQNWPGSQGEDTPAVASWASTVGPGPPTSTHVYFACPIAFPAGPQVGTR